MFEGLNQVNYIVQQCWVLTVLKKNHSNDINQIIINEDGIHNSQNILTKQNFELKKIKKYKTKKK